MDYEDLGLKAGLEIHQQLDTDTKLFCNCPTELREFDESAREFHRYLHPTKSELGEVDRAALEEARSERKFSYLGYDTTCLVEEDDEPPRPLNRQAIKVSLQIAEMLDMKRVDQCHVMRKIVIDGSNTTGFQRTALIAYGGSIDTSEGEIGIDAMSLEEESAQIVEETEQGVRYSLDRLGIPLVEIGTDPDISSPSHAQEAAEELGMILRSTGMVKRGLGTIRQDLNVSIEDGARIEMKGVQDLGLIGDLVEKEAERQVNLLEIRNELQKRDAEVGDIQDVSDVFSDTESGIIKGALNSSGVVLAVKLSGFDGLVGREIQPDRRLGTELSDRAQKRGAGGIFHTDELPGYGINEDEISTLRDELNAGNQDAIVLLADDPGTAESAMNAVIERAETALEGVPEETRDANEDGTSSYLRPLPGAARMYPETDIIPIELGEFDVEEPLLLTKRAERYAKEYSLNQDLAERIAYSEWMPVFEAAIENGVKPGLAARTVEETLTELRREGVDTEALDRDDVLGVLGLVRDGEIAKEGVPEVLERIAEKGESPSKAVESLGLSGGGAQEVDEVIGDVLDEKQDMVEEQGMEAFSALMGLAMEELRGRADGEVVSDVLREKLQERT